jgi:hypothetical protein
VIYVVRRSGSPQRSARKPSRLRSLVVRVSFGEARRTLRADVSAAEVWQGRERIRQTEQVEVAEPQERRIRPHEGGIDRRKKARADARLETGGERADVPERNAASGDLTRGPEIHAARLTVTHRGMRR